MYIYQSHYLKPNMLASMSNNNVVSFCSKLSEGDLQLLASAEIGSHLPK